MNKSAQAYEPTDGAIVARILAGEREAYRLLVLRHQDSLYRYALGMMRDADAAADRVQSAFIKGYTKLHRCRDPERFGAWVFRIVVNECRDEFRSRHREVPLDPISDSSPLLEGDSDPAEDFRRTELDRMLDQALDRLSREQREAFVLKHIEDRSYDEMAEILGASVSALKMRVHRARGALRADLGEVLQ